MIRFDVTTTESFLIDRAVAFAQRYQDLLVRRQDFCDVAGNLLEDIGVLIGFDISDRNGLGHVFVAPRTIQTGKTFMTSSP